MKTIEIDDDVYEFLKSASEWGEDRSVALRRLLRIPTSQVTPLGSGTAQPSNPKVDTQRGGIQDALADRRFKVCRTAVDRFLFLLSWMHAKHRDRFEDVLTLGGRSRVYFARTRRELDVAGTSVNARQIPNTEFWVVTNNDTRTKEDMLSDVMGLLGYGPFDIAAIRGRLSVSPLDDIV